MTCDEMKTRKLNSFKRLNFSTPQRMKFVELHACSAFSFLRGGSFPEQLAEVAAELEMPAMALLDRDGVYGAQRFSVAAREHNVRPIIGAELSIASGRSRNISRISRSLLR